MVLVRDAIMASGIIDLMDNVSGVEEKVAKFEDTLISIMDKFMPLKTKTFTIRPDTEWFNDDTRCEALSEEIREKVAKNWAGNRQTNLQRGENKDKYADCESEAKPRKKQN